MSVVESSLLGKETIYPTTYDPSVLFPIARATARQAYATVPHITQGVDWWHIFELSWLDGSGKPQVALGRLHLPASSPYLIESKSLKLYFNSLNFTKFNTQDELIKTVERDLSISAQANICLEIMDINTLNIQAPYGRCIDDLTPSKIEYQPNAQLLKHDDNSYMIEDYLHSHLLRSNCPVTNQPDWGTIFIRYQGKKIDESALLAYIISYREHNGFHEQCVEQIFADIWTQLQPEKLMVYATYTRRGGLDINPCRTSDLTWLVQPIRLARQ